MYLEKKDVRKIMLQHKYEVLHLSALERGDTVAAQKWLEEINLLSGKI